LGAADGGGMARLRGAGPLGRFLVFRVLLCWSKALSDRRGTLADLNRLTVNPINWDNFSSSPFWFSHSV